MDKMVGFVLLKPTQIVSMFFKYVFKKSCLLKSLNYFTYRYHLTVEFYGLEIKAF